LKRRKDGLKVSKIAIEMPLDLASEIFIETGDLPVAQYPALEELAEIIAQVLNVGDEIQSFAHQESILCGVKKQK